MLGKILAGYKGKEKLEYSSKNRLNLKNKLINSKALKKTEKEETNILNKTNNTNDLLNENTKLNPMANPIPFFKIKNENSTKDEISTQNSLYSNINKQININISYNIQEENKKNKTKVLDKKMKKTHISNYMNNKYFRQYSPNFEINSKNEIISYSYKRKQINSKFNHEIFFSNTKKVENNKNKKKIINPKNILSSFKKKKILNHLYFSTDNFYDPDNLDETTEKLKENKEEKKIQIKLLGQKINIATMKIEILQNYKKDKNINKLKKKIEYNKIYCNNDLKRIKDNYYININSHINQIKYMKMKLLKYQEIYIPYKKHIEEIKKEELLFKIKKMEIIDTILYLKKKINDKLKFDLTKSNINNLDDSLDEKTIKDISFNDYSKDNYSRRVNLINNVKINGKNPNENKIIKINKQKINFFKGTFINNAKNIK